MQASTNKDVGQQHFRDFPSQWKWITQKQMQNPEET